MASASAFTRLYRVAFRMELHDTPDTLQTDLDEWMVAYNDQRTQQAR